jgi:hypothetical protein
LVAVGLLLLRVALLILLRIATLLRVLLRVATLLGVLLVLLRCISTSISIICSGVVSRARAM